ncbi:response regulator [Ferrimonas balearica]|uniref:response regulator n=1 Tax=Ferrimonas balearica TaxID=44012 RepID=UPI001C9991E4|nr:response regulator [Ferrimonas balearica]MBY5920905.1 response regulator [Ferrimonas balearica]MBY5996410.1 response regulator [Ferrimonas balearica]
MTEPLCIVVDDNPINAMLLEQALVSRGCRTFAITEPLDAARVIEDAGVMPAMIIIDQVMPELLGHQLAINLRSRLGDQCTFVAWSAATLAPEERMVFDEVLAKPLKPEQLDNLVALLGLGHQAPPLDCLSDTERTELMAIFAEATAADIVALTDALAQQDLTHAWQLHHKLEGSRAMLDLPLTALDTLKCALDHSDCMAAQAALEPLHHELRAVVESH